MSKANSKRKGAGDITAPRRCATVRTLLCASLLAASAYAPLALADISAGMVFNAATIGSLGTSNLQITLTSNNATATTFTAGTFPALPSGLTYTGTNSTTCTGLTVAAAAGGAAATLSGTGTIPATGSKSCTITLQVKASTVASNTSYSLTLPASYFTTSDTSNPPGTPLLASLTVTPPNPVAITAYTGVTWMGNSLYSTNVADFADLNYGVQKITFTLTNSNPVPLTGVQLDFPLFPADAVSAMNIIPNTFLPGAVSTTCASGAVAVEAYAINPATPNAQPSTGRAARLAGATIPASGNCTVTFRLRYDATTDNVHPAGVYTIAAGALSSIEGSSNTALNYVNLNYYSYINVSQADPPNPNPDSGYQGETADWRLRLMSISGVPRIYTLAYSIPAGVQIAGYAAPVNMDATSTIVPACTYITAPVYTAGTGGAAGTLTLTVRQEAGTYSGAGNDGCYLPFTLVSDYNSISPAPALPYQDVTPSLTSGTVKTASGSGATLSILGINNTSYRAIKGTRDATTQPTVTQRFTNLNGGSPDNQTAQSNMGWIETTISAGSAAGFSGLTMTQPNLSFFVRADSTLSYVPAMTNNCSGSTVNWPVGGTAQTISGVTLAAGQSCTIRVPVLYNNYAYSSRVLLRNCSITATVGGNTVCAISDSYAITSGSITEYGRLDLMTSTVEAGGDVLFKLTLTQGAAGSAPVESYNRDFTLAATAASSKDYSLRAVEVLSNNCGGTVNGLSNAGAITTPAALLQFRGLHTPSAQSAGRSYNDSGDTVFDTTAFANSTCEIMIRATSSATPGGGQETIAGGSVSPTNYSALSGSAPMYVHDTGASPILTVLAAGTVQPPVLSSNFYVLGTTTATTATSAGTPVTYRLRLSNTSANGVTLTGGALSVQQAGLDIASPSNLALTTVTAGDGGAVCSGTLTPSGTGAGFTLSNAVIPRGAVCDIRLDVQVKSPNPTSITINAGDLTNSQNKPNTTGTIASISLLASMGVTPAFTPATLTYNPVTTSSNTATLTLALINAYTDPATGAALTYTLPAGLSTNGAATISVVSGSCAGLTAANVTVNTGSVVLGGATLASGDACTISVPVKITDAAASVLASYSQTIAAGAMTATVSGSPRSNTSSTTGTLTVVQPTAIVIAAKAVTGATAGKPASASYPVSVTCTNTGTATGNITEAVGTTIYVQGNDTACAVTEGTKPTAVAGYAWGTETITGGTIASTTPAGTVNVTVSNPLALNASQSITFDAASSSFTNGVGGATVSGGTLPDVSMICAPVATGTSPGWTAPTSAECTLTLDTTSEVVPTGYTLDGVQFFVNGAQLITVKAQGTLYGGNTFAVQTAPAPGNTITFKRILRSNNVAAAPIPALDAKALLLLMLLAGGAGLLVQRRQR